jgi:prefoldin subunit 5
MFLKEELDSLAKQHRELEDGIASLDTAVEEIEREAVSRDTVKADATPLPYTASFVGC